MWWEKNLAALGRHYPALAARLKPAAALKPPPSLSLLPAASGGLTVKVDGALVHSARDPVREARRLAEGALEKAQSGAAVVLGFGLGYAAEALTEAGRERPLVIVEKRIDLFVSALTYRDLRALFEDGRHIFVLDGPPEGIYGALSAAGKIGALLKNPALLKQDAAWYAGVERQIELWRTKDEVNAATLARFGRRWTANLARNLPALCDLPGIRFLAGQFDFPILLLAAGPSLDELRPHVSALRQRCVVVAVDTAARFLESARLEADFIVSADPQYWNLRHLDRLRAPCLITQAVVQNAALRLCQNTFLASSFFPLGRFMEEAVGEKGALGTGGSVATSAFDFAFSLLSSAARPLYIAGLDLAFPHWKTHFQGALFEERTLAAQSRLSPAETERFLAVRGAGPFWGTAADGGRALTDKRLSLYARWFENRLRSHPEIRAFSFAREGLRIEGLPLCRLEDALAAPPCRAEIDQKKEALFAAIFAEWNAEPLVHERARRSAAAWRRLCAALEAFGALSREAAAAARGNGDEKEASRALSEASRLLSEHEAREIVFFSIPEAAEISSPSEGKDALTRRAALYTRLADEAAFIKSCVDSPSNRSRFDPGPGGTPLDLEPDAEGATVAKIGKRAKGR